MEKYFEALTAGIIRWRWWSMGLLVLLLLAVGAPIRNLGSQFNVEEFFERGDPERARLERMRERFGADDATVVVAVSAEDVLSRPVLTYVEDLTRRLAALEEVGSVQSLTTLSDLQSDDRSIDIAPLFHPLPPEGPDFDARRARALQSPLINGTLLSSDRHVTLVLAELRAEVARSRRTETASERIRAATTPHPPSIDVAVTGVPVVRGHIIRAVREDQWRFVPLGTVITVILLFLLYRSVFRVVIPLAAVGGGLVLTLGLMVLSGNDLDILTSVLPVLVIVYGVADGIHTLSRVHEEAGRRPRRQALIRAMGAMGMACLLTSTTTAIGFASLVATRMEILQRFGLLSAMGVMAAYLATLFIVPVAVALLPIGTRSTREPNWLKRPLGRLSEWVPPRRKAVLAVTTGVVALSIAALPWVRVDSVLLDAFDEDHPTRQATRALETHLRGVVSIPLSIEPADERSLLDPARLDAMATLEAWLEQRDEVTLVQSALPPLRALHRAVHGKVALPDTQPALAQLGLLVEGTDTLDAWLRDEEARMVLWVKDLGSSAHLAFGDEVERFAQPLFQKAGMNVEVTGTSMLAYRGINKMVINLLTSLSLALLVITLVLFLVFRDLKAAFIALIPNSVPLLVGLAVMPWLGMALEPTTVMIFSIAFGIAVDDTIHFFARYREEVRRGRSPVNAVRVTMVTAGQAMTVTSMVLVLGFATVLSSQFPSTRDFGFLGMIILATAWLTDLVVTPTIVLTFRPFAQRGASVVASSRVPRSLSRGLR